MPLQVADPQDELGDGGGAGIELDAEELVGIDGVGVELQAHVLAKLGGEVEHLAFEDLELLEGDVEKVAAAAGGIEHAEAAEAVVVGIDLGAGLFEVAFVRVGEGGGADGIPFLAQRLDDGGEDEALHIRTRREVGAEGVAISGIERPLQKRAEDGGLDVSPVRFGGLLQQGELEGVHGQDSVVLEEAAVEPEELFPQDDGEAGAGIHLLEEGAKHRGETFTTLRNGGEQLGEGAVRQEAHVLREHAEEAAREELGGDLRLVAAGLEALRQLGEVSGDLAGDIGADLGGIERGGLRPDEAQALPHVLAGEVFERDAEAAWIGEREVGLARLGEVRIDLDAVADIADEDEGRVRLLGGEGAHITLGLAFGADHGIAPSAGVAHRAGFLGCGGDGSGLHGGGLQGAQLFATGGELLRLEDEVPAPVEVDEVRAAAAGDFDGVFEAVAVGMAVRRRGHAEQMREAEEEGLGIGAFIGLRPRPVVDEGFRRGGEGRDHETGRGERGNDE